MQIRSARLPGSPLWLRFGRAGTHVKPFGWVVLGNPCQLVRAGHLGGGTPRQLSLYQKYYVVTRCWICARSCSSFAYLSLVASFRSWAPTRPKRSHKRESGKRAACTCKKPTSSHNLAFFIWGRSHWCARSLNDPPK